jgi:hypothetical protein
MCIWTVNTWGGGLLYHLFLPAEDIGNQGNQKTSPYRKNIERTQEEGARNMFLSHNIFPTSKMGKLKKRSFAL